MSIDHSTNRKNAKILVASLLIVAIAIVTMNVLYIGSLQQSMREDTHDKLSEVSNHVASMINERVENGFQVLRTAANVSNQFDTREALLNYLHVVGEENNFTRITLVYPSGEAYTSDGHMIDVSSVESISQAWEGKENVSSTIISEIDGQESILYSIPVYAENGNVSAVLVGTSSVKVLRDVINVESFGGEGFSLVIDHNGNYILKSDNHNVVQGYENYFSMIEVEGGLDVSYSVAQIKVDIANNKSGFFSFTSASDNMNRTITYMPLSVPEWYLFSVVPTAVAGEQAQNAIDMSIVIACIMVALFIVILYVLYRVYQKSNRSLEQIAFVDPVTGGANRTKFEIDAGKKIRNAPANTYAVVSLDIQKFKLINDSFGSMAGDKTLRHVFDVVGENLRDGEIVARISADTFCLLLYNAPQEELGLRLDQMAEEINRFNDTLEKKYFLPFSQGVYIVDDPLLNMIVIQDRANVARKSNKGNGSKLVLRVFYSDLERIRMVREKEISDRISYALDNHEFEVYLQPKYEIKNDTVAGAEALVRWNDPEKGLIPPNDFIPVLENNGYIVKLDLYVFEEVCILLRKWIDNGLTPVPISVNLSRVHLVDPDFLKHYCEIREKYDIPSTLLEIELTESLVFENMEILLRVIEQIHAQGFTCSLDDFGSGYSSLNMLKDIPVDVLKLDRAFFLGDSGKRGEYVVESIINLAQKLDMGTVAEGVDNIPQVDFLRKIRCDMVQGYVFAKPLPACEFEMLAFHKNIRED